MKQGSLSDFFVGAGVKVLKGTEVDRDVSRGHELQGISDFRAFLGSPTEKTKLPVTYVWLADDTEPLSISLSGTWYDSRKEQTHRDPEYRLYYPAAAEDIVYRAKAGDTLFLCQPRDGPLLALFCSHNSSIEKQLLWLFGLKPGIGAEISQVNIREQADRTLDLTARYILELIGVEVVVTEDELLDRILATFGEGFPPTNPFSTFARETLSEVDGRSDPDGALVAWMDFEERLFMTLEKHIVGQRLSQGFMANDVPDVDGFIRYSLSVQNRRKSRAGWAFANHVEALLKLHDLRYVREATTEKRAGADFLFPDERSYHDPAFPVGRLTMLGAKTSCKDRWRQVLAEADRIPSKHLITLEPGISRSQTDEMLKQQLTLVVPRPIQGSYEPTQLQAMLTVTDFIELVRGLQ